MAWIRNNWIVVMLLCAVILSFVVQRHDSLNRDHQRVDAQIANCVLASARSAVEANGWHRLSLRAELRNNKDDPYSAASYQGTADSVIALIPPPSPVNKINPRLAETTAVRSADGSRFYFTITPRAQRLQVAGCNQQYGR
jgi:hypothetical protein